MEKFFAIAMCFAALMQASLGYAQHPYPQPMPMPLMSRQTTSADGLTTFVESPLGPLPVGENLLPSVDSNIFDSAGEEMVNTLPSRPGVPFNLIDGPVRTFAIDKPSPKDDLGRTLTRIRDAAKKGSVDPATIQFALDILEGNPIPNRVYSGFALLHYTGPEKWKRVEPIYDAAGNKVGGNVDIHQIWYENHIESDTAFIDPSDIQDVPFTVTYTVDVLNSGADDFAPFVMYFDVPNPMLVGMLPPHAAMDAAFYPMGDGTRYVIKVKHSLARLGEPVPRRRRARRVAYVRARLLLGNGGRTERRDQRAASRR